jgi:hypothetical protein
MDMADYGSAVTFGAAKAGREQKALELWADTVTLNDKAVANGRIDRWDAVIFEPSPTGPAGAVRVYGTEQQVEEFIRSEDFQDQLVRAQLLCHDIGIRRFMTGEALVQGFVRYAQLVNTL